MKRNQGERVLHWLSKSRRNRRFQLAASIGLALLAPILVGLTYFVLGPLDRGNTTWLRFVLLADFAYVMVVIGLIVQAVVQLLLARRRRSAGARLHLRLAAVFAVVALVPSVVVAVFAVISINFGFEGWFSDRVKNVVGASLRAAQAYAEEHRQELTRDAQLVADFLAEQRRRNPTMGDGEIRQVLGAVQDEVEYFISETFVIDGEGEIHVRGGRSYDFDYEQPEPEHLQRVAAGETVLIEDQTNGEFRALMPLQGFTDRYLQVTRDVDGEILALLDDTRESVGLYQQVESDRGQLLFDFALLYLGFALIMVLAATWLGLQFAERLSRPIGRLLSASEEVGAGDLEVRVPEEQGDDEIAALGRNFNLMTSRLNLQRAELLSRTDQIEKRRRQFDSVLSSVTSGVVGLDPDGRVTFVNRSARRLLDVTEDQSSEALVTAVPEFGPLFEELRETKSERVQEQVTLLRGGKTEILLVRMSPRWGAQGEVLEGYVVAFDDVTDLVTAQRTAAWGDVARRIAHEIKNPLTPIQLSAERIKRKYRTQVEDSEGLEQMTDVIVRQTNDLRRIVDEFSKFARMPEPDKTQQDLIKILRDVLVLQETGQPDVRFDIQIDENTLTAALDATMISQALTNLIKNAGEAIESLHEKSGSDEHEAQIQVRCFSDTDSAHITIADNGIGLPEDRSKLFEPYVTTRDKGTGLGLPIVKKIIEEHGGTLSLQDAPAFGDDTHFGAMAVIELPLLPLNTAKNGEHDD